MHSLLAELRSALIITYPRRKIVISAAPYMGEAPGLPPIRTRFLGLSREESIKSFHVHPQAKGSMYRHSSFGLLRNTDVCLMHA